MCWVGLICSKLWPGLLSMLLLPDLVTGFSKMEHDPTPLQWSSNGWHQSLAQESSVT